MGALWSLEPRRRRRKRHPNHRLVKTHHCYTVDEAAKTCSVHRNTVRHWMKVGLKAIDAMRPTLIQGRVLRQFLEARRSTHKRPCRPAELYCFKCRAPRRPAGSAAEYRPSTAGAGSLFARCPDCGSAMNKRISQAQLAQARREIEITFPQNPTRIGVCDQPCVNSDFNKESFTHA
jgi:hypothetical protein